MNFEILYVFFELFVDQSPCILIAVLHHQVILFELCLLSVLFEGFPSLPPVAIWAPGAVERLPRWGRDLTRTGKSPSRGLFPWYFPTQQPNEAWMVEVTAGRKLPNACLMRNLKKEK